MPGRAWAALTAVLLAGSVLAWWWPAPWLDWQPELATAEPWRAFTAVWVHWSESHLLANLLAAMVVGAYGFAAPVPAAMAWAWLVAWPLTHIGLFIKPELLHYGGLSGVLHAGVAIVSLWLLVRTRTARWRVGAPVMLGLVIKLATEEFWGPALQRTPEFDIAVAPIAHATGAVAGLICAAVALWFTRAGSNDTEAR